MTRLPQPGAVVLDIGDGVGALVVYTAYDLEGREIEVSPVGSLVRIHTVVHPRDLESHRIFAGVFPSLPEGDYTILTDDPNRNRTVTIMSGLVTEVDLRE